MNVDVLLDGRLEHGAVVEVRGAPARVSWLGGRFHQLRLQQPVTLAPGDRIEAGGVAGVVLDADAPRHPISNDLLVALTATARELGALRDDDASPDVEAARAAVARLRAAGGEVTATRLARELRTTAAVAQALLSRLD